MKALFILFLSFFFSISTYALPVVNENIAPPGLQNMVVWRDHQSPSHFYILPKGFRREDYYQWGFTIHKELIQVSFRQDFDTENIYKIQDYFYKNTKYPSYGEVEFEDFNLNLGSMMDNFVTKKTCYNYVETTIAHLEYDGDNRYVHCRFYLNEIGMNDLVPFLQKGKFLAYSVSAKIKGMKRLADGSYIPVTIDVGFPLKLNYPKSK
jgi:hypothetical protein